MYDQNTAKDPSNGEQAKPPSEDPASQVPLLRMKALIRQHAEGSGDPGSIARTIDQEHPDLVDAFFVQCRHVLLQDFVRHQTRVHRAARQRRSSKLPETLAEMRAEYEQSLAKGIARLLRSAE